MSRKLIERDVLARIRGLLDMWYTSLELAEELKVSPLLIRRRWVRSGLPHRREQRSIWIRGTDLMHWANQQRRERQALGQGQAYCMHCRGPAPMLNARLI